jgi:hypothetical protein
MVTGEGSRTLDMEDEARSPGAHHPLCDHAGRNHAGSSAYAPAHLRRGAARSHAGPGRAWARGS